MAGLMDFGKAVVLGFISGLLAPIASAILGMFGFIPTTLLGVAFINPLAILSAGLAVWGALMITRNVGFLNKVSL